MENIKKVTKIDSKALKHFIQMCLDYYTYSKTGDVLVTDSEYDKAMELYKSITHESQITTTEFEESVTGTHWQIIPHVNPEMVGSIEKVYTIEDLYKFLRKEWEVNNSKGYAILAPKYDGVSVAINVINDEFTMALTRKDGYAGQNILELVMNAENIDEVKNLAYQKIKSGNGCIKCEILCSTANFEELKKVAGYSNRRSAVSGIVSTPSNIKYAKYLTIMPLLYKDGDEFIYAPEDSEIVYDDISLKALDKKVNSLLSKFKDASYSFRCDGVVCYIPNRDSSIYSSDAMCSSIAFKTNSNVGITTVIDGYMSIGRTGLATPMIKVAPVDVNETIVEDVSLSNMRKANKFGLRYGDQVSIESSGDVIPMLKEVIKPIKKGKKVEFSSDCPYCGHKLRPFSENMLGCVNPNCIRIKSGRIINFLDKMGAPGISDETILQLLELHKIDSIDDVLNITEFELSVINGWGEQKAKNFVDSIRSIKEKPKSEALFLGSLGIPNISIKRTESICSVIDLDRLIDLVDRNKFYIIEDTLMDLNGFASKSIKPFIDFLDENINEIKKLRKEFNLVKYKPSIGEVVFTGFRNPELEERFRDNGFSIGNSVNKNTMMVVTNNVLGSSTKLESARQKNIRIFSIPEAEEYLRRMNP